MRYDSWVSEILERQGWKAVAAVIGVVLGGLGLGWRGVPGEEAMQAAILTRARAVAVEAGPLGPLLDAEVEIKSVRRDWVHEVLSTGGSYFYVRASVLGESACYRLEPDIVSTMAYGPLSSGCD